MQWTDRIAAGPDLEWRLPRKVAIFDMDHPHDFAVRLHVLGDFYSVEYVELWRKLLMLHRALYVFGYTARQEKSDPICVSLHLYATIPTASRCASRMRRSPSRQPRQFNRASVPKVRQCDSLPGTAWGYSFDPDLISVEKRKIGANWKLSPPIQSRPFIPNRPVKYSSGTLLVCATHCLKWNATPCRTHRSRMWRTHSGFMWRAPGPLTPPAMAHQSLPN
jgi:hypothetical protein